MLPKHVQVKLVLVSSLTKRWKVWQQHADNRAFSQGPARFPPTITQTAIVQVKNSQRRHNNTIINKINQAILFRSEKF